MAPTEDSEDLVVATPDLVFVTVNGSIGIVATISQQYRSLLALVQEKMREITVPFAGLSFKE